MSRHGSGTAGQDTAASRPDAVARERVDRLRRELCLVTVPTMSGTALRHQARLLERQLAETLPTFTPQYDRLSVQDKRLWHSAVHCALDEFIGLVEMRPHHGPLVDDVFVAVGRAEGRADRGLIRLLSVVEAARAVLSGISGQLSLTPGQDLELDEAMVRYVRYLHRCVEEGYGTTSVRASTHIETVSDDETRIRVLLALFRRGWAMHPTAVHLTISNPVLDEPEAKANRGSRHAQRIGRLLLPLSELPLTERVTLAHALRLWLDTRTTSQDLAALLQLHQHGVLDHLGGLLDIYFTYLGSPEDTLALLAALDLVIPLWEQEMCEGSRPKGAGFL